jgi:hypothetical protein
VGLEHTEGQRSEGDIGVDERVPHERGRHAQDCRQAHVMGSIECAHWSIKKCLSGGGAAQGIGKFDALESVWSAHQESDGSVHGAKGQVNSLHPDWGVGNGSAGNAHDAR